MTCGCRSARSRPCLAATGSTPVAANGWRSSAACVQVRGGSGARGARRHPRRPPQDLGQSEPLPRDPGGSLSARQRPDGGIAVLRPVLLILTAVAAVVLLITCANLAGLLLARGRRQTAIAIRLSMGAGRWRIVQQLLVEGMVLSSLGAVAALIALRWTSGLLIGFAPPSELPIHLAVNIDATVVWFTALLAIATVLLFAVAPAAQAAPADVATTLRDSVRQVARLAAIACADHSWRHRWRCRLRSWSARAVPAQPESGGAPDAGIPGRRCRGRLAGSVLGGLQRRAGPRVLCASDRPCAHHARRGISVAEPPHSAGFQRRQLHRRDRRRSSEIRRRSARRWIELRRAGLRGDLEFPCWPDAICRRTIASSSRAWH